MGDEGKTAAAYGGRRTGISGVRGGDGELDCRRMEGRNLLSRRRSGGVRGGRVVEHGDMSGVNGEPGAGKSRVSLMRFLTLLGKVLLSSRFFCRRRRNKARQSRPSKLRAEHTPIATLVPVASWVSGVVVVDTLFAVGCAVSTENGALLLALAGVGSPLCVASIAVGQVDVGDVDDAGSTAPILAADSVCVCGIGFVHCPTDPYSLLASVIHV